MIEAPPVEIVLVDTSTLSRCIDAGGLGPKAAYVVNEKTARLALNALSNSPHPLVTTSAVYREIAADAPFGIATAFMDWQRQNPERLTIVPTWAGSAADPVRKDAGERSLVELLDAAKSPYRPLIGRPYLVATDDLSFKWEQNGVPQGNVVGIAALLNKLLKAGTLPVDDYATIRDGLIACPLHINGVKPSRNHPAIMLDDEELMRYRFHTPVIMPDAADVRATSRMGRPIRPGKT